MLAPHYMDAMPEAIRKRTREEDETGERHDGAPEAPALSFSEHRNVSFADAIAPSRR